MLHEGQTVVKRDENLYNILMLNGATFHLYLYWLKLSICSVLAAFSFAASTRWVYAEVTDKKISKDMDNLMAVRMMYGTGKWYKRQELPKETDFNNEQIGK